MERITSPMTRPATTVTIDPTQPVAGASAGSGAMLRMMVRLLLRMRVLLPRGLPPSSSQVVHATGPKARKRPLKCTTSGAQYYQHQSRFALVVISRRCRGIYGERLAEAAGPSVPRVYQFRDGRR